MASLTAKIAFYFHFNLQILKNTWCLLMLIKLNIYLRNTIATNTLFCMLGIDLLLLIGRPIYETPIRIQSLDNLVGY